MSEDTPRSTASMESSIERIIGEQIQKVLLDDTFILKFAELFAKALKGEPLVKIDEIEVIFSDEDTSPKAFQIEVTPHDDQAWEVKAYHRHSQETVEIHEDFKAKILDAFMKSDRATYQKHWVTLNRVSG